jgi:MHS family metabolite:H+ symporter-like MFS transporter
MTDTRTEASAASQPGDEQTPPKGRVRSAVSGLIGTTLEFFDLQLYGLAAALVFPQLFFSDLPPAMAGLASFATYAVGFFARPVGAFFFARIGDKHGRKTVLIITITLMGIATTLMGLLPTYAQIGVLAPVLLVLLRVAQGFGAGAELSGASVLLSEFASSRRRGIFASLVCLGTNSGTLLASGIWLAVSTMPEDVFLAWGWRIPFVASVLVAAFAIWVRKSLSESPVFTAVLETVEVEERTPVRDLIRHGRRPFFISLALRIGENGPSYLLQSFLVGYVVTGLAMEPWVGSAAVMTASIVAYITIPIAGWLSDRFGRRVVYRALSGLLVVYSFPAWWLLQSGEPWTVFVVMIVGLSIGVLGLYAVQSSYFPELFGSRYRYLGLAMGKEIGGILAGGIAPLVAASLVIWSGGSWIPIAAYMALLSLVAFIGTFFAPETQGRDLTLESDPA